MEYIETVRAAFDIGGTDKGHYHTYEYMYAMMFAFFEPKSILEIGVKRGKSIAAWQTLFPSAEIAGIDIQEAPHLFNKKPFNYMIGDSTKFDTSALPKYDVIIDDGDHSVEAQIKTFDNFKTKFNYFYVIEDINFVKNSAKDPQEPVTKLIEHIKSSEFFGIASFHSYNTRKDTKALVILSRSF